ncbi:MAG: class I SAM-dependent methyltransferase [Candidatus Kapaibacterium sp.]|nr:MAG: class I SAM-dependent methyltransferase [Candidatus Kapabacteria bacterium]
MLLGKPYFPRPEDNRYENDGDVVKARRIFYEKPSKNLLYLLRNRFAWMQDYITPTSDVGVEVGCGIGITGEFVKAKSLKMTDFGEYDWLDMTNIDAMNTPFHDAELDFVLCSNMIHHLPSPMKFLREMHRIIKPGGYLLVQEVNCSLFMRLVLHLMRKEGYSYDVNVFDENAILSDPTNPWAANAAIPNLLFDSPAQFHSNVPTFRIERDDYSEFLLFFNSGGVTAKTPYIPLPYWALACVKALDLLLIRLSKNTFALQRSIVLKKI